MVDVTPPAVPDGMDYVAFDLDGTLARGTWPSPVLGEPIQEGIDWLLHYVGLGYAVVLHTARPAFHRAAIEAWLKAYNLHDKVYDIVTDKPLAGLYIDDRAVRPPWAGPNLLPNSRTDVTRRCYSPTVTDTSYDGGQPMPENGPFIIGLTGHLQAGKDSVGLILTRLGYQRLAFADALKALGREIGWDGTKSEKGRHLLQVLGVSVREILGEDTWIRVIENQIEACDPESRFTITDVRFPNEAEMICDRGGEIWLVRRPGYDGDGHVSERFADEVWADVVIENDGTLEDLEQKVRDALE